jgi:hypothetical protein
MTNVLFQDPSPDLVKLFPLKNFVGKLYDPSTNKPVLAVEYVVPNKNLKEFLILISLVKEKGLCSDLTVYKTGPAFRITSPFHKVVDIHGNFHADKNDPAEIDNQMRALEIFLERDFKVEILPAIKRNPMIIPVLAEYLYEHRSSVQVWNAIKSKLGESVWDYIKFFRRKSDGVGLKKVQMIIKNLSTLSLLNHMRVVYFPIEIEKNFTINIYLSYKNENEFLEKVRLVSLNSLFTSVLLAEGRRALLISSVNGESLQRLFELFSSSEIEKVLFFDYFKSMELVTTTTYSIFDYTKIFEPKTCSWIYSQEEMVKELENLS